MQEKAHMGQTSTMKQRWTSFLIKFYIGDVTAALHHSSKHVAITPLEACFSAHITMVSRALLTMILPCNAVMIFVNGFALFSIKKAQRFASQPIGMIDTPQLLDQLPLHLFPKQQASRRVCQDKHHHSSILLPLLKQLPMDLLLQDHRRLCHNKPHRSSHFRNKPERLPLDLFPKQQDRRRLCHHKHHRSNNNRNKRHCAKRSS